MISHTMSDLMAPPAEEDRMKARGFVERSGMVICGGWSFGVSSYSGIGGDEQASHDWLDVRRRSPSQAIPAVGNRR